MNTTEELQTGLQPCPDRPRRRGVPVDGFRILTGYAVVALALLCGIPVLVICLIAGNSCTAPGFGCLGWLVYGMLGAGLVAASVALALAVKFRLGVGFWLVLVAVLTASTLLPDDRTYTMVAVLAAPAAAAWLTHPVSTHSDITRSGLRHWLPRLAVLVALVAVLPLLASSLS